MHCNYGKYSMYVLIGISNLNLVRLMSYITLIRGGGADSMMMMWVKLKCDADIKHTMIPTPLWPLSLLVEN